MVEIGVVERIYTEDQRGFTINLRIKLAQKTAVFGNRKMLDSGFDMGAWWLKRLCDVFQVEDAMRVVGKPCVAEIREGFGGSIWVVVAIARIDGTGCFNPDLELGRRQ